jgi:uncharacterized protein YjbJ (UPF0337 family)
MTKGHLQDRWNQLQGEAKVQWGQLTPEDLERIVDGDEESLIMLLQERYGYDRDRAAKEVEHFRNRLNAHIYLRYRFP